MKRILSSIIIAAVLLMSLCNIGYAASFAPTITAEGGNVGDTITVTVAIPADTDAAGGSFNLVYDNTKMTLVDAAAGNILSAFSKTVNKTYAENKIRLNFAGTETVAANGGTLLEATFLLTGAGNATISTEKFKLADVDANYLACTDTSVTVTVAGGEATIVPAITAEGGTVGDTVKVTVAIPADTNAAGGSFNLVYDNTKMELADAIAGEILGGFTCDVQEIQTANGVKKVKLTFYSKQLDALTDGGVLLTAEFKLTSVGTAQIYTENFELYDVNSALDGTYLPCEDVSAYISIEKATAFIPVITAANGKVGDTIDVTVAIPADTNAAGGSFNLVYDNTKVQLVDATAGEILSGFSKTVNKTYDENKVRLNFAGSETIAANGGVILNAAFTLLAEGSATFSTEKFKLADIDANYLTCTDSSASISIEPNVEPPVPVTNKCGDNLTWRFENGVLIIEGTGEMYDYSSDGDYTTNPPPWFELRDEITSIVLPEGLTRIGDFGLVGCTALKGIELPSTLVSIGERAFMDWISLEEIELPKSVTTIEDGAFEWNDKFSKITIYEGTVSFGEGVFEACNNLTIYGIAGSQANIYANANKIPFVAIGGNIPDDEDAPKITVSSIKTLPGKEIEITIDLENNTGFASLGIEVGYNINVMTLTAVTANTNIGATFTPAQSYNVNPFNMAWDSAFNVNYNGRLVTLTFAVAEDAPDGVYPITLDYYKGVNGTYVDGISINYDEDFEPVGFEYISGNVTIRNYTPGDINGDESIDNRDATCLLRYLAGWQIAGLVEDALDVDGNGEVSNRDATILLRYLAGWDVILH